MLPAEEKFNAAKSLNSSNSKLYNLKHHYYSINFEAILY